VSASVPPSLPVVETFHSLQGEGLHAGRSAFFIRLAGCTVGCSWCDTKHSWPAGVHPQRTLGELGAEVRQAAAAGAAFVVITGGEPLHHDLSGLCTALRQASHNEAEGGNGENSGLPAGQAQQTGLPLPMPLHLETSGVDPLSGQFDWITLSPKRHRPPTVQMLAACHELKVVVEGGADLVFAEAMAGRARQLRADDTGPALLLQPAWESAQGQELAIGYVRSHPTWRLSLQSHKWLGVR
jgi:organic radical activating enzyme